ncbi:MAG: SH3 domain-containing protein [Planctomycetes bacterium]|nr:SH3 domain-containing protein [Planctomycetota bacterium]
MVRLHPPIQSFRRRGALLGVLVGLLAISNASAQEPFPYVAYVVHADSYVRSGPGQRYYPTQQLPQGFAVEVYRHDGDGWCAIRPPEGSFCWVAAHEVRLVEPNVAEVIAERTVTRVGSTLSPTRSSVQVLLERGERMAVVTGSPSDDRNWLRVAPPAGEFRWIAARDLGRQAPLEVSPPTPSVNAWSRAKGFSASTATSTEPSTAPTTVEPNAFDHLRQMPGKLSVSTLAATVPAATYDAGRVDIVAGSPADLQLAQFQGQSQGFAPVAEATPPRIRFRGLSETLPSYTQQEIPERLREIELRLSQIVIEPPLEWQFDQLQLEADSMLQQAESPEARAQLRDLLERIARFQQVRDGYSQISQATSGQQQYPVPTLGAPVNPMADLVKNVRQRVREDFADPSNKASAGTITEPLYDAVGLLKPVVSRRKNAPQYALVDGKGDVVSFVTPTPDLNLKPYVGRRIGVNGTRGFMTEFRRAHVTAGRVTPIDAPLRR